MRHGRRPSDEGRRPSYISYAIMVCAATLGGLTQNIMNTALPSLMADLSITVSLGQLLTTVFPLCLGVVIPLVAFLSKRFSTHALSLAAMIVFLAGSVLIGVAGSFWLLLAGRILQGAATGIVMPLVQVVVLQSFPRDRWGLLMGIIGLAMGFAPNVGPTIAGAFTSSFGWRSCFYFLSAFALAIICAMLVASHPHEVTAECPPRLDFPSVLFSTLGFGDLLLAFSNATSTGFASPVFAAPLVIGTVFVIVFCHRQSVLDTPLLDLTTFADRRFTIGTVMVMLLFAAFIGVTLVIPLHLQTVCGYDALTSGLVLLPGSLVAAVMSPLSGLLMDKVGMRPVAIVAAAVLAVSTGMLADMGHTADLAYITTWQTIRLFGISSLIMPLTVWSVGRLSGPQIADGTSVTNALRQVAASLGTAIIVVLMAGGTTGGSASADGVSYAMCFSFLLCAIMLLMAIIFVRDDACA